MLVADLIQSKNHEHNEKSHQHNDSVTNILNRSPSLNHQHNVVTNITVTGYSTVVVAVASDDQLVGI